MEIKKIGKELMAVVFKYETFHQKREVGQMLISRINELKIRRKRRILAISYSVAASVVIFIAIGSYMISENKYTTQNQVIAVVLPDSSHIQIEANSKLSYNRIAWYFERNVRLDGAARFKVSSGEQFTVKTTLGDIRVLGTEFSVISTAEKLNVECFEGSVEVTTGRGENILHKGDKIECTPTENIFTPQPQCYEYRHASMSEVLQRIEQIYGVNVLAKDQYKGIAFDGLISTQSLTQALDVLTLSCNMNYSIENNDITIRANE